MHNRPCSQCRKLLNATDIDHDFRVHGTLDPVDENSKVAYDALAYWCQRFACRKCGSNFERREEDAPFGKVKWMFVA